MIVKNSTTFSPPTGSSTSSNSLLTKPNGATFFVPSLQELISTRLINQLGSIEAIEKFLENSAIDIKPIFKNALTRLQSQVDILLNRVVKGKQKEAEEIIKANPTLLLSKGTAIDYSNRTIHGTAFQIALGAEDVRYQPHEECMIEMIKRYLKQLPDGEEEIAIQIHEQFPDGWEKIEEKRVENDWNALQKVVNAISNARPCDDCETELQEFRDYLKPIGIIKTGKHFNIQLLVQAFKLYDKNFNHFDGVNSHQNHLFWTKVIGYIERFLPACYAQACSQGIYYIVENSEKLTRSLKFRFDYFCFFPLDNDPHHRLGYDYAFAPGMVDTWVPLWPGGTIKYRHGGYLANYVKQKTDRLQKLIEQPNHHSALHLCAMM